MSVGATGSAASPAARSTGRRSRRPRGRASRAARRAVPAGDAPSALWATALVASASTAVMAAAASRPWGLGALALVAYVPAFLAVLEAERPAHGAVVAAVASLGLGSVAYEAAEALFPGGHLAAALLASVPYLPVGALAVRLRRVLARRLGPLRAAALTLLVLPSLWSAAEWLPSRPELLGVYALPLGFIGYSQVDLPTARLARLGSVAAVSHVVLLCNACVAVAVVAARRTRRLRDRRPSRRLSPHGRRLPRRARAAAAVALLAAATSGYPSGGPVTGGYLSGGPVVGGSPAGGPVAPDYPTGGPVAGGSTGDASSATSGSLGAPAASAAPGSRNVSAAPPLPAPPSLWVTVVQPVLPDAAYFAASRFPAARARLVGRLASLAVGRADLTVLPEAAWPGPLDSGELPAVTAEVSAAFGGAGAVLFGAPAVGFLGGRARTNSAFLYDGSAVRHAYAKLRLVPIGESGFAAGGAPAVVTVAGVALAPFVCYDALFPSDARAAVRAGARVLVVITDDAFAAGSDVPELHLRAARMRAIETGTPVVLAANTGPSAVVEPSGRVAARLPALEAGSLRAVVRPGDGATTYVALGDWLGAINAMFTGGLAAALARGGDADKGPAQAL